MNVYATSGESFEIEVFGIMYRDVPHKYRKGWKNVYFKQALFRVKQIQSKLGWNARKPKTKLIKAIYNRVASRLGKLKCQLRVFNCIGTWLDCQGFDCVFECNKVVVTVDITVSVSKSTNADILLTKQHFVDNEYDKVADEIARRLVA